MIADSNSFFFSYAAIASSKVQDECYYHLLMHTCTLEPRPLKAERRSAKHTIHGRSHVPTPLPTRWLIVCLIFWDIFAH